MRAGMTQQKTGYTREDNEQIAIVTIYSSDLETVDAFLNELQKVPKNQSEGILNIVIDMLELDIQPYFIRRLITAEHPYNKYKGHTALIVPNGYDGYLIRTIVRQVEINPDIRHQAFFNSREKALAWIKEKQ